MELDDSVYQGMEKKLRDLNSLPNTCATPDEAKRRQVEYLSAWLNGPDHPIAGIRVVYDEEEGQYIILDDR